MTTAKNCDILISARFLGDENERKARQLHKELERLGLKAFIVDVSAGQDFGNETAAALNSMNTMLAFACDNYGAKTGSKYSSYNELKYAYSRDKCIIPIIMSKDWPPKPKKDIDGEGAIQNDMVFIPSLLCLNWSNKRWDAAACAQEVKGAIVKKDKVWDTAELSKEVVRASYSERDADSEEREARDYESEIKSSSYDVSTILRGMRKYRSNHLVQQKACEALRRLTDYDANNFKMNRITITAQGGHTRIIEAMRNHGESVAVQEYACGALGNLSNNTDNQVKIAEEGGLKVIVAAMKGHTANAPLQEKACLALYCTGSSNTGLQQQIKREGAEEVVQRAMQSSNATANTKLYGQMWLNNLK